MILTTPPKKRSKICLENWEVLIWKSPLQSIEHLAFWPVFFQSPVPPLSLGPDSRESRRWLDTPTHSMSILGNPSQRNSTGRRQLSPSLITEDLRHSPLMRLSSTLFLQNMHLMVIPLPGTNHDYQDYEYIRFLSVLVSLGPMKLHFSHFLKTTGTN